MNYLILVEMLIHVVSVELILLVLIISLEEAAGTKRVALCGAISILEER